MVEMIEDRMDYESRFRQHLEALHAEGRYRVFADLKRRCGAYPTANHFCGDEVSDVTVRFGGLTAVDQVSFGLEPGEICALIGPNGAGKSTLFNAIAGNVAMSGGRVVFRGGEIGGRTPHEIAPVTFHRGTVAVGDRLRLRGIEIVHRGEPTALCAGHAGGAELPDVAAADEAHA